MQNLTVGKFGGTSMATGASYQRVALIHKANPDMLVTVVSAAGNVKAGVNHNSGEQIGFRDDKVTNVLIRLRDRAIKRANPSRQTEDDAEIEWLVERYAFIMRGLPVATFSQGEIDEARRRIESMVESRLGTARFMPDGVPALGEEWSAEIFTAYLNKVGTKATCAKPEEIGLLALEDNGKVTIPHSAYVNIRRRIEEKLASRGVLIVPGFYAPDVNGVIRVLPRGGSDFSAIVLAGAMGAQQHNFSDTAFRVADPRMIPSAFALTDLPTDFAVASTSGGANQVMQYETVARARVDRTPILVRDTFADQTIVEGTRGGTLISPTAVPKEPISAITVGGDCVAISIRKPEGEKDRDFGERVLDVITQLGLSFMDTPTATERITITLRKNDLDELDITAESVVRQLMAKIPRTTREEIQITELSRVSIVGAGIKEGDGELIGKIYSACGKGAIKFSTIDGESLVIYVTNGGAKNIAQQIYSTVFEQKT